MRKYFSLGRVMKSYMFRMKLCKFCKSNKTISSDEKFWQEYIKRKDEQKEIQTLDAQFTRKNLYEFKYGNSNIILSDQLINCIQDLERNTKPNFLIIDLRNEIEINHFKLPHRTKVRLLILY